MRDAILRYLGSRKAATDAAFFAVSTASFYYLFLFLLRRLDPGAEKRLQAKQKSSSIIKRLRMEESGLEVKDLTEYEQLIMAEVIAPEDIEIKFADIGGLDEIIDDLQDSCIYPLAMPHLFAHKSALLSPPKGVLLYGPPGVGKTMLAKALARESKASFINLHISSLTDKWFGESNKLVSAVFSLARKLAPSIIFIDEIDAFLRERQKNDFEVTSMLKAEFMTLWDGLTSAEGNGIIILGATNRPHDIDQAIMRRMPKRFAIKRPDHQQRLKILKLMLRETPLVRDFDFGQIAMESQGMTGSDLKDACRDAAMVPVREYLRLMKSSDRALVAQSMEDFQVRPLCEADFFVAGAQSSRAQLDLDLLVANSTEAYRAAS